MIRNVRDTLEKLTTTFSKIAAIPQKPYPKKVFELQSIRKKHNAIALHLWNLNYQVSNLKAKFTPNNEPSMLPSKIYYLWQAEHTDSGTHRTSKSCWKNLNDQSIDVKEVLKENIIEPHNIMDKFNIEALSQEQKRSKQEAKKRYTLDLPDSSDCESIQNIVISHKRLFDQKENRPQKQFDDFGNNSSANTTPGNKTLAPAVKPRKGLRNMFGTQQATKRYFIGSTTDYSSEEEIVDVSKVQRKLFDLPKPGPQRRTSARSSSKLRNQSPTSNDMAYSFADWDHLPSSTMVDNQLEAALTGGNKTKRSRLRKQSQEQKRSKQEAKKRYTLDLPDSSDCESIQNIVISHKRLFDQKENRPQKQFDDFGNNSSANTTVGNKTLAPAVKPRKGLRNIFGTQQATKRYFFESTTDYSSEEEIVDVSKVQRKLFDLPKPGPQRRTSARSSSKLRNQSPTSNDMAYSFADWDHLPSSTMVDNQLEAALTGGNKTKRSRLRKPSEASSSLTSNSSTSGNKSKRLNKYLKNKSQINNKLLEKIVDIPQNTTLTLKSKESREMDDIKTQNIRNTENKVNESERESEAEQVNESNQNDEDALDNILPPDISHDTTGRKRKNPGNVSIEAVLFRPTKELEHSFVGSARNTTVNQSSSLINPHIEPEKIQENNSKGSLSMTEGRNSSAEGSDWDSHKITRKTLRQTLGEDFTPRKSSRALVMKKSAKRHAKGSKDITTGNIPLANSTELGESSMGHDYEMQEESVESDITTGNIPLANSTELGESSMGHDYEMQEESVESEHEVSIRTRKAALEEHLKKIKRENDEKRAKMAETVKKLLEQAPQKHTFKVPGRPTFQRRNQAKVSTNKKLKLSVPLEDLPTDFQQDLKYKPPKRYAPRTAAWLTKRFYKYVESKLKPKYDYKARVRAEKFAQTLHNFVEANRRRKIALQGDVDKLKHEMARLKIVNTHFEFYNFFWDFMPREVRLKVIPDLTNKIPQPRNGIFSDIIVFD